MDKNLSPIPQDRNNLLLYSGGGNISTPEEHATGGRITHALSGAIAFDRSPSIFDSLEIQERDALIKSDEENSIQRAKPVELTSEEFSTTLALSFGISQEIGIQEIKDAITRIREKTGGANISRYVPIADMAKFIYGRADSTQKAYVIRDLFALSRKTQILMIGENKNKLRPVISPLIKIDPEGIIFKEVDGTKITARDFANFLRTATPEQIAESVEGFNVGFGVAFLYNLDTRWGYIPERVFPVLRRNKTELFRILYATMVKEYIRHRNAADAEEARVKKEINRTKKVSREEYAELIREARQGAMTFERDFSTIKLKLKRDYDSTKQNRQDFKRDLKRAALDLQEIGLIVSSEIVKGAKRQEKARFILSETYNFAEVQDEPVKLLKGAKRGDAEIDPF